MQILLKILYVFLIPGMILGAWTAFIYGKIFAPKEQMITKIMIFGFIWNIIIYGTAFYFLHRLL